MTGPTVSPVSPLLQSPATPLINRTPYRVSPHLAAPNQQVVDAAAARSKSRIAAPQSALLVYTPSPYLSDRRRTRGPIAATYHARWTGATPQQATQAIAQPKTAEDDDEGGFAQ